MPVILPAWARDRWLDPAIRAEDLENYGVSLARAGQLGVKRLTPCVQPVA
jgi:hypothetical protein